MPTVLMIHSGGFTSRQWRRLGDLLTPRYRVLAPDLLGYGESGPWPEEEPVHFDQDLLFLESLLDEGHEAAHVIGHSYGGFLALQLALRRPELVCSLAVYDPVAFGILDEPADAEVRSSLDRVKPVWEPGASGADEQWLREFVDWWNGEGAWERLAEETRGAFRTMGWKVFHEVMSLLTDRTDRVTYARIAVPTLVLGGALSPATERRVVEKLGTALPHATVRFIPGVGHMGPISHASIVNEAIAAHIDGV